MNFEAVFYDDNLNNTWMDAWMPNVVHTYMMQVDTQTIHTNVSNMQIWILQYTVVKNNKIDKSECTFLRNGKTNPCSTSTASFYYCLVLVLCPIS